MRRTLKFFEWKSSLWSSKASQDPDQPLPLALREGVSAYALRQADVFMSLRDHFRSLWQGLTALNNLSDQPAPFPVHFEEAMQGVDGGDVDLG